jgi:hypothetical protein
MAPRRFPLEAAAPNLVSMNRIEIEKTLNEDRAWLLNTYAELSEAELTNPVTPSEHDDSKTWNAKDHLVHLILIERNWNDMIRKHIAGERNTLPRINDESGKKRPMAEILAGVHEWTETWAEKHRTDSLDEIVALGQHTRSETLQLLSELTQEQIDDTIPGAPWAEGKVGGIIAANAGHGRMHWQWVKQGREEMAAGN